MDMIIICCRCETDCTESVEASRYFQMRPSCPVCGSYGFDEQPTEMFVAKAEAEVGHLVA